MAFTYLNHMMQVIEEISIFLTTQTIHFIFILTLMTQYKFTIQIINHKNLWKLRWINLNYFYIGQKCI